MFEPQQKAPPPVGVAHTWRAPTVTDTKSVCPPPTGLGTPLLVPPLVPSCQKLLSPQQKAAPAVVIPHVVPRPALIDLKRRFPATATGAKLWRPDAFASPSSPRLLSPQQNAW